MAERPRDTEKVKINLGAFYGGASIDLKYGIQNSFYYAQAWDFRKKASQMNVLPGARSLFDSQTSTLSGLIEDMDQDINGNRYGLDHNGIIYKIDTSNVLTQVANIQATGGAGLYYSQNTDQLYAAGQQTVSLYGPLNNSNTSPSLKLRNFGPSVSVSPAVTNLYDSSNNSYDGALRNTAAATYTPPSTIAENAVDKCPFSPDIEPFYSIKLHIASVGTGSWTLTLHDGQNNNLASVTLTHAQVGTAYNEFVFPAPVRAIINQLGVGNGTLYHFHITTSTNDGTVAVVNANDLSTADFQLYATRLVAPHNGWHPMVPFAQYLCIGNERYLSTYDFTNDASIVPDSRTGFAFVGPNNQQWIRHQLIFRQGYEVCGLATNDQFLVIALERRSTSASRQYQDGQLAFWDGGSQGVNFYIDIPMGAPYGLHTFNNITYFYCAGSLYAWAGGKTVMKVRVMAYQNSDYLGAPDTTIVNPHMMDSRYNLLMLGYPSSTTNVAVNYGVWSWGSVEMTYPNSFALSYVTSNGQLNNTGSANVKIGMVKNFVDTMYITTQYTDANSLVHYGVDLVDNTSNAAAFADWQSLIWDGGAVYKQKQAHRLYVRFLALPTGCTLQLKYSIDRSAWQYDSTLATTGATSKVFDLQGARFHELQWGFEVVCPAGITSPPTVTGVTMEIDPLANEVDVIQGY